MALKIEYYFLLLYLFWVPIILKDFIKKYKYYLATGALACFFGFWWEAIIIYLGYWKYKVGFKVLGVPLCVVSGYFIYISAVYFLANKAAKK